MKINFPTSYKIKHEERNYQYYTSEGPKKRLRDKLIKASNSYCMYCGKRIADFKNFGELEHSIEKTQNKVVIDSLKNCKHNFSISCGICNKTYKKGCKSIAINKNGYPCNKNNCTNLPCAEYNENLKMHLEKNQIILMPYGYSYVSSMKDKIIYEIKFNIKRLKFEVSLDFDYTEEDFNIIKNHIEIFHLNDVFTEHENENMYINCLEDFFTELIEERKLPPFSFVQQHHVLELIYKCFEKEIDEGRIEKVIRTCKRILDSLEK